MRERPAASAGHQRGFLMKFTRKAQLALTAVAAAAPLALALPAQASTTTGLCTVTPQAPVSDHLDGSGQKVISYGTTVYCQSGRSIEIQDQRWDDDTWDLFPAPTIRTASPPTPSPSPAPPRSTNPPPRPCPIPMPGETTTRRCTTRRASRSPATASPPRGRSGRTAQWSRSTCEPRPPAGTWDPERRGRRAGAPPPAQRAQEHRSQLGG
jgi:hypothetical protein